MILDTLGKAEDMSSWGKCVWKDNDSNKIVWEGNATTKVSGGIISLRELRNLEMVYEEADCAWHVAEGAHSSGGWDSWVPEDTVPAGEIGAPLPTAELGTIVFISNEAHLVEDRLSFLRQGLSVSHCPEQSFWQQWPRQNQGTFAG